MASDLIGKIFGSYKLVARLGQGGMAAVYRGYQESIDRSVAIKVLPAELLHDPNFLARFTLEARTLAKLTHPYILPLYDFGQANNVPYIVMPLMTGGSLADRLRRGSLSLAETTRILSRVAEALDFAHGQGIIHRDMKPNNILFDSQDNPFLADFGIAKAMEATSSLTGTGIIGTPDYMSPEQARGEKLDSRSDIYSTGVVVYQCLTGQQLFKATTPLGVILKHVSEPPRPLRDLRPDLPQPVESVVLKALSKRPDDRYQGAVPFAQALSGAAGTAVNVPAKTKAADATVIERATTPMGPAVGVPPRAAPPRAEAPPKRGGIGRWLVIGSIVGVLAGAAVCGLSGLGSVVGLFLLGSGSLTATAAFDATSTGQALARTATAQAAATEQARAQQATATQRALAQQATATQLALVRQATSTAAAAAGWPVAFADSFSRDTGDWFTGPYNDDYVSAVRQVVNGKYQWDLTALKPLHWESVPRIGTFSDFTLTVDVQQVSGPRVAAYGVVFREVDRSNYYFFLISNVQQFAFSVTSNGKGSSLIDWTTESAIRPGEVNTLSVTAKGSHFTLSINGNVVAEADDSQFSSGKVGVTVELYEAGDAAVFEFDNFQLNAP